MSESVAAPGARHHAPSVALAGLLALATAWLLTAAWLVSQEYYDGLDTILNARWLTGTWGEYHSSRGPMWAILLAPAAWLAAKLGLAPLA